MRCRLCVYIGHMTSCRQFLIIFVLTFQNVIIHVLTTGLCITSASWSRNSFAIGKAKTCAEQSEPATQTFQEPWGSSGVFICGHENLHPTRSFAVSCSSGVKFWNARLRASVDFWPSRKYAFPRKGRDAYCLICLWVTFLTKQFVLFLFLSFHYVRCDLPCA